MSEYGRCICGHSHIKHNRSMVNHTGECYCKNCDCEEYKWDGKE